MKFTLLFDLDDTLLATGTDQFLRTYMKELGGHLAKVVDPDRMIPQLLYATGEMVKNQRPDRSLEQVFDDAFYAPLGLEKPDVIDLINDFYLNRFPVLRNTTHPRPKAIRLINNLLAQGHRVVIATNPVFPQMAIEQRLEWAGLSSSDYDFAIVPGYEHFHFAKPNPAYYTELLARLGYPTDPVIMVGNDPRNDIIPSSQVGILPFLLHKDDIPVPTEAVAHGDFDDLEDWLENLQPNQRRMQSELHHLPVLRTTPAILSHFNQVISADHWRIRKDERDWSLVEHVCHLRDIEAEINLPRIEKFINEDFPSLQTIEPEAWAEQRDYLSQNGMAAINQFMTARVKLLDQLNQLPQQLWLKKAVHTSYGEITLHELLGYIAEHDIDHIQQIAPLVA